MMLGSVPRWHVSRGGLITSTSPHTCEEVVSHDVSLFTFGLIASLASTQSITFVLIYTFYRYDEACSVANKRAGLLMVGPMVSVTLDHPHV